MADIKCPAWLDDTAKKEWRKQAPALMKDGRLTEQTSSAFATYCQAFSQWQQAAEKIKTDGMIVTTKTGYPIQAPWVSIEATLYTIVLKFSAEFGLTPAARARINAKNTVTDDPARTKTNGFLNLGLA